MKRLAAVSALIIAVLVQAAPARGQIDPWRKLADKRGWIVLAAVRTEPNFLLLRLIKKVELQSVPTYTIVGDHRARLPRPKERLVLTQRARLEIVRYHEIGEKGIQLSPARELPWEKSWETGIVLAEGTIVVVEKIGLSEKIGPGELRVAYALVSPGS